MKCYQCGGWYREQQGALELKYERLDDAHYYECVSCCDVLLPLETMKLLDMQRKTL